MAGERSAAALVVCAGEVLADHGLEVEYVALVDPDSFTPLTELDGDGLLLVAARAGDVRLIDNEIVGPGPASQSTRTRWRPPFPDGGVNQRPDRSPPCQATPQSEPPPTRCGCR